VNIIPNNVYKSRTFAAVVLTALFAFPNLALAQTFDDVPTDHWAYSFIETLAATGITAGCGGGMYCPEDNVSRAQMAVFLERGMNGSSFVPSPATGNVFLDLGAGDFAASFIEKLFADGITAGCGSNNYCPNATVTRDQMAVFLLRAKYGAGYSPPAATGVFGDVPVGYWAAGWIEQLAAEGITAGCGGGNYCPESPVNRDQMAVFLVRAFDLTGHVTVPGTVAVPTGVSQDTLTMVALNVESPVASGGTFEVLIYRRGVAIIAAMQESKPFGLMAVVITDGAATPAPVAIDSRTTATTMVFLAPQLITTNPENAQIILAAIGASPSLNSLVDAVNAALADPDPLVNTNILSVWQSTVAAIADEVSIATAVPSIAAGSLKPKIFPERSTPVIRLPRLKSSSAMQSSHVPEMSYSVDLDFTTVHVQQDLDTYYIDPDSERGILGVSKNAVDWLAEIARVDEQQFVDLPTLVAVTQDPYSTYPRIPQFDSDIGQDIIGAEGYFRVLDFTGWLFDTILRVASNLGTPTGIPVSATEDAIYIVRNFSGGWGGYDTEQTFALQQVPNGAANYRKARVINMVSVSVELFSLIVDISVLLDDAATKNCMNDAILDIVQQSSTSIELSNSVFSELITAKDIASSFLNTSFKCVASASASSFFNSFVSSLWNLGNAGVYVDLGILAERMRGLMQTTSPLESVVIVVGTPLVEDSEPPTIPTSIVATVISTSQIDLQWSPATDNVGVAGYRVFRDGMDIGTTSTNVLSDVGLAPGIQYCYEIEAFDFDTNISGRSSPAVCATTQSNPDTAPPTVPQNVVANALSDTTIDLSWSPSSDDRGVSGYEVYRDDQPIGTVSDTTILDTGLMAGTQYCYTVVAYDVAGNPSDPSAPPTCATTAVTPDTTAPTVPTGVIATAIADNEINVAWDTSSDNVGVTGYRIFRDTVPVGTTPALDFSDSGLVPATTYCYTVSAFDAAGIESVVSSPAVCATTLAEPDTNAPTVPTGLVVTVDSASQLSLTWEASTDNVGVDEYQIYRDDVRHATTSELSFADQGLSASTNYCYTISAIDPAGNESGPSSSVCATTATDNPLQFTKIVDSNTILPGEGSLSCNGVPPMSMDSGRIAFEANSTSWGGQAIYVVENGNVRLVAGADTPAPGAMPSFGQFAYLDVDGPRTYFTSLLGLYVEEAGSISLIADVTSSIPGGGDTFGVFTDVAAANDLLAFQAVTGSASSSYGIYRSDGSGISVVAGPNTPDPGNVGNFAAPTLFTDLSVNAGQIAFGFADLGTSGYSGIYRHDGSNLEVIANINTVFPGGQDSSEFFSTSNIIDDAGRVLFFANDGNFDYPIYAEQNGVLSLIVDTPMTIAGTAAIIRRDSPWWAADSSRVVLHGYWERVEGYGTVRVSGLYVGSTSEFTKIIDSEDLLDGKALQKAWPNDLDGGVLDFFAEFDDGSCGIYTVDLN